MRCNLSNSVFPIPGPVHASSNSHALPKGATVLVVLVVVNVVLVVVFVVVVVVLVVVEVVASHVGASVTSKPVSSE